MGKKVLHVGDVSKGTSLKMLVNAMLGESMLIFSETLLMGEEIGFSNENSGQLLTAVINDIIDISLIQFKTCFAERFEGKNQQICWPKHKLKGWLLIF